MKAIMSQTVRFRILLLFKFVLPLALSFATLNAQPPVITNQAVAVYVLHGVVYESPSNVVRTTVLPVYSFEVVPNGSVGNPARRVLTFPGNTVYIGYVLRNLGNAVDSYRLQGTYILPNFPLTEIYIYEDLNGNGVVDPGENVPVDVVEDIPPSGFVYLILAAGIPPQAMNGDSIHLNLIATSVSSGAVDDDNWSLVVLDSGAAINAWKLVNTPVTYPGDTLRYEINFMNVGRATADSVAIVDYINYNGSAPYTTFVPNSMEAMPQATFSYLWRNDMQWHDEPPQNPTDVAGIMAVFDRINPGQYGLLSFRVVVDSAVPDSVTIEDVALVISYGSQGRAVDTSMTNLAVSVPRLVPIIHIGPEGNSRALPGGEGSSDDVQSADSVDGGQWLYFRNTLLNEGDAPANIELIVNISELGLGDRPLAYLTDGSFRTRLFDSDGDGFPDIGPIPPGMEWDIGVKIWIPDSLDSTSRKVEIHRLRITAFPEGFDSLTNSTIDQFTIREGRPDYSVSLHKTVLPDTLVLDGTEVTFEIEFENIGGSPLRSLSIYDRLDEPFENPAVPETTILADMNGRNDALTVLGEYNEASQLIRFYIDSLPVGFKGVLRFRAKAIIRDSSANEDLAENIATCMSQEMGISDTSNRVSVHILRPILEIEKNSIEKQAEIGDIITYTIRISNEAENGILYDIVVYDTLPEGVRPILNSLNQNSVASFWTDSVRIVRFHIDSLPAGSTVTLKFEAAVGPGTKIGQVENVAWVEGRIPESGTVIKSGPAVAVVEIREGFATKRGFIFGKVFVDENDNGIQDSDERGVPGVVIRLDNGLFAVTDSFGKYSIPNVLPGIHGLWLDLSTVPDGLIPLPVDLFAFGDGRSQMVELTPSSNRKVNFRLVRIVSPIMRYETGASLSKTAHVVSDSLALSITLPSTYFETGKAELTEDAPIEEIQRIAELIKNKVGWKVVVEGHTDPRPIHTKRFPDNYALSLARANAVANLLKKFGVPDSLIEVHGYGPDRPKVPNTSPENMAVNRRTEIRILPYGVSGYSSVEYRIKFIAGDMPVDSLTITDVIPNIAVPESLAPSREDSSKFAEIEVKNGRIIAFVPHLEAHDTVELSYRVRVTDALSAARFFNNAKASFRVNGVQLGDALRASVELDTSDLKSPISYTFRFPSDILFETARAKLRPQSEPYLEQILKLLKAYPQAHAVISGHTDSRPIHTKEFPSNMELSKARAMAVYRWLVTHGIDSSRLEVRWFGASRPLVPNINKRNMALNRRTEVKVYFPPSEVKSFEKADSSNVYFVSLKFRIRKVKGDDNPVRIEDRLRPGFEYVKGSAVANGRPIDDPQISKVDYGTKLVFSISPEYIAEDTLVLVYAAKAKAVRESKSVKKLNPLDTLSVEDVPLIISPTDGQIFTSRSAIDIDVLVHYMVPFELLVNGEKVPKDRCGLTKKLQGKLIEEHVFVGIRLKPGENEIVLKGVNSKGKMVEHKIKVYASGPPAFIEMEFENAPFFADGVSKPRILLRLTDKDSLPTGSNIVVTLEFENVEPMSEDARPSVPGFQVVVDSGTAHVELKPSSRPIRGKVMAYYSDKIADTVIVDYLPPPKPFELFAMGDLRGGARWKSGHSQKWSSMVGLVWGTGRIWRDVNLTFSFRHDPFLDSLTDNGRYEPLFGTVSPLSDLYPTYGDASSLVSFATSRTGLFLRLEKGLSYVQYGDFSGFGMPGVQLNLSNYRRALTGLSFHIDGKYLEIDGVAAQDGQVVKSDEFAADGTYGPFYLSNSPIVVNSEEIWLVTRDKNHPEIIVQRIKLKPGVDYELEPSTGRLDLKFPAASFDDDFNPNYIVVVYEVIGNGGELAYGGKLTVHPTENTQFGFTLGHSSPNRTTDMDLRGGFAKLGLGWLRMDLEAARSYLNGEMTGSAYSLDLNSNPFSWLSIQGKYARKSQGFSNPSSVSATADGEDANASAELKITKHLSLNSQVNMRRSTQGRKGLSGSSMLNFKNRFFGMGIGYRHSVESNSTDTSSAQMAVLSFQTRLWNRLGLVFKHEHQFSSKGNLALFPPRTNLKLSLSVTRSVSISLSAEHLWDTSGRTAGIIGLDTKPWRNASAYAKYQLDAVGSTERNQVITGISQTVPITSQIKINGNIEYIKQLTTPSVSKISIALGGQYRSEDKILSFRLSDTKTEGSNEINGILSSAFTLHDGVGLVFDERFSFKGNSDFRLEGILGLAARPNFSDKLNLFASLRHSSGRGELMRNGKGRVIAMLDWNYQPIRPFGFWGRFGAKRILSETDAEVTTYLISAWTQYEFIDERFYGAVGTRSIIQSSTKSAEHDFSLETGLVLKRNMMFGLGYNLYGITEKSWFESENWQHGAYITFRIKYFGVWR